MKTMIVKAATVCLVLGIVLSFGNEAEAKTMIKRSSESDESYDNEECTAAKEEQSRMIKVVIKCVIEYLSSSIFNIGGINIGKSSTSNTPSVLLPTVFGKWSTLPGVSSCITTNFPHDPKLTMEKYQEKCKSSKGNEAGAGTETKEIPKSHDDEECTAAEKELEKMWEAVTEFEKCIAEYLSGMFSGIGSGISDIVSGISDIFVDDGLINTGGLFPLSSGRFPLSSGRFPLSSGTIFGKYSSGLPNVLGAPSSGWSSILRKSNGGSCIAPIFSDSISIWEKYLKSCKSNIFGNPGPAFGGDIDMGKSRSK